MTEHDEGAQQTWRGNRLVRYTVLRAIGYGRRSAWRLAASRHYRLFCNSVYGKMGN
jgi:hypothetical protein